MIVVTLKVHGGTILEHLIDEEYKQNVLKLLVEAQNRTIHNKYTGFYDFIEESAVKAFPTGRAHEILIDKLNTLGDTDRHRIKLPNFIMLVFFPLWHYSDMAATHEVRLPAAFM